MKAKALVELKDSWGPDNPHTFHAVIRCSECSFMQWSSVRTDKVSAEQYATNSIQQHLETHEPGRAPDITVDYVVSADCSVCSDGGDVQQEDSEVLQCAKCDTTWNINGTSGELAEAENS